MGLWVDTDFGFDDLWALLVLEAGGIDIDGVSLVAGNSQLEQVCKNAFGAFHHFGFPRQFTKVRKVLYSVLWRLPKGS